MFIFLSAPEHSACRIILGLQIISASWQKWRCWYKKRTTPLCQGKEIQTTQVPAERFAGRAEFFYWELSLTELIQSLRWAKLAARYFSEHWELSSLSLYLCIVPTRSQNEIYLTPWCPVFQLFIQLNLFKNKNLKWQHIRDIICLIFDRS